MNTINETEFKVNRIINRKDSNQSQGDAFTSEAEKRLENYDRKMDEKLIEAKNVGDLYAAIIGGKLQEINRILERVPEGSTWISNRAKDWKIFASKYGKNGAGSWEQNLTRDKQDFIAENPEEIRKLAYQRIAFCEQMVKIFQKMLTLNNELIGFSMEEAQCIASALNSDDTRKEAVEQIKAAFMKNREKFDAPFGYDFRKVGGGIILLSNDQFTEETMIPSMVQYAMTWDCTAIAHGNAVNKKYENVYKKLREKFDEIDDAVTPATKRDRTSLNEWFKECDKLREMILHSTTLSKDQIKTLIKKYNNTLDKMRNSLRKDLANGRTVIGDREHEHMFLYSKEIKRRFLNLHIDEDKFTPETRGEDSDVFWATQPLKTPWGQKYTNIATLCEDLIKHGFKRIKLVQCNPAHIDLRKIKSLRDKPGVVISFSLTNTAALENVNSYMPMYTGEAINEGVKDVLQNLGQFLKKVWDKIKASFFKLISYARKVGRFLKQKIVQFFDKISGKNKKNAPGSGKKEPEKPKETRHIRIDPDNGNVVDRKVKFTPSSPGPAKKEMQDQADNIDKTAKVLQKMVTLQDVAFKNYQETIDALAKRGEELARKMHANDSGRKPLPSRSFSESTNLFIDAALALEAACGMNTLTGGIVVEDEEPSKDYLKDYPSFA